MPDTIPLICRSCGAPFDGTPKTQFCPDCKKARHKEQARQSYYRCKPGPKPRKQHELVCRVCGLTFFSSWAAKTCPNCRDRKKLHAVWYQAHKDEQSAKDAQYRRARMEAMTPEELEAFKAHEAERARKYYAANKAALNAKRAQYNRERIAAMTPEEKRAYYDALYAKRRECKRKKEEQSE